jgi:glycosyltransferase involved in cell wall biosynthesis
MRICYMNYEWDLNSSTGAATQIDQTAAGLRRLGHDVEVVNRHRKPDLRAASHRRPGFGWLWETAHHLRSLRGIGIESEILRRLRPDVVLALHALRFSILVAAGRLGIPVVLQVNASVPFEMRRYRPEMQLLPGLSEAIEHRMLEAADGVFVVSAALREYFAARGVRIEAAEVIPNGADPQQFRPEAADRSLRIRFPGKTLVGFVGSFAGFHGLELLESAVVEVARRDVPAHFVFAGPGERLARRLADRRLDRHVTFLGYLPHERVPSVIAAMDVLLAPYSPQECFYFSPLKLFEYLACGRAVLAAGLGQIAEVIHPGVNGLLYQPEQPGDFEGKLVRLVQDPELRERLGEQARRTVLQRYTWDHAARRISELLERVTSSVPRPTSVRPASARWRPARSS